MTLYHVSTVHLLLQVHAVPIGGHVRAGDRRGIGARQDQLGADAQDRRDDGNRSARKSLTGQKHQGTEVIYYPVTLFYKFKIDTKMPFYYCRVITL